MCNKKQFTKKEAQGALNNRRKLSDRFAKEKRYYHCPDCNMWHLTSKN